MMSRFLACAAVSLALTAGSLAACKSGGTTAPPPPPAGSDIVDYPDLPVPRDFTVLRDKSCVISQRSFRNGKIVYVGSARLETLRDWYKKSMVSAPCGWTLAPGPSGETGVGPYTLRFEKGVERCEVFLESPMTETVVTLTLGLK
jgi:hypothetical protein